MANTFTGLKLQGMIGKFGAKEISDIEGTFLNSLLTSKSWIMTVLLRLFSALTLAFKRIGTQPQWPQWFSGPASRQTHLLWRHLPSCLEPFETVKLLSKHPKWYIDTYMYLQVLWSYQMVKFCQDQTGAICYYGRVVLSRLRSPRKAKSPVTMEWYNSSLWMRESWWQLVWMALSRYVPCTVEN